MIDELKIVQNNLEKEILSKIDKIRENIMIGKGPGEVAQIAMLDVINEELSDVLLNWEPLPYNTNIGDDKF
tara:strand:- start:252 stop:464 length:213 start_codon:yes stop_codon:yes gene_type:complete